MVRAQDVLQLLGWKRPESTGSHCRSMSEMPSDKLPESVVRGAGLEVGAACESARSKNWGNQRNERPRPSLKVIAGRDPAGV